MLKFKVKLYKINWRSK